ncbi:tryptophan synthase subunit alpha [Alicyclobacillus dauci]|uniref:Tryptophan synthase alpha chain n=1 Tax=Alicyclobacillus dauci TaxID=1475485 RepID=A0ABY6YYG9_9BACL|nr:tryptophan synthase subunit alpha [Alicyclobacillus dauci]WAH35129.1 tryptophan synthase subunit alpha [Alicyclobacillus dauci]
MNRIERTFKSIAGRAALIPFVVAGDPDFDSSRRLIQGILESGADMIEIGLPYSDPLADGPVIQAGAVRSLQRGFQLPDSMRLISDIREQTDKPLIAFTYVNPILQYGIRTFFEQLAASGGDGVIVPDVPLEEAPELADIARENGISFIPLVAPTSGDDRVRQICTQASGFVYCVSSLGVTGERASVSAHVESLVESIKRYTAVPACVGFGVSSPEHAREISRYADGVIVGSAYVRRIEKVAEQGLEQTLADVRTFTAELKIACM